MTSLRPELLPANSSVCEGVMLILRPTWPEMYSTNLTFREPVRTPKDQGLSGQNLFFFGVFCLVLIFNIKHHLHSVSKLPLALLCCALGIASSPLILLALILFGSYRLVVRAILAKNCPGYRCLMAGADACWSLEMDTAKAVINILAFIESSSENNNKDLRTTLKRVIEERLLSDDQLFKMKCFRRLSTFGYFYWEDADDIHLDDHIRFMELKVVTEGSLTDLVSDTCNNPLPRDNQSLWEVLVARSTLTRGGKPMYPVLFRVHHALGDGIALVNLFLSSFTDGDFIMPIEAIRMKRRKGLESEQLLEVPRLEVRRKSSIFLNDELIRLNRHCVYGLTSVLQRISVALLAPYVLVAQACYGVDANSLHGGRLNGSKHVGWAVSTTALGRVKHIKNAMKCTFTDVILLVISNVFENHFSTYGLPPRDLTLVIPARMPSEDKLASLQSCPANRFTVGMIKLPIHVKDKFTAIRESADRLRTQPDYLVNYWLLKIMCTFFPIVFLKNALESRIATVAMSNIPGPGSLARVEGNLIHDLVFWPPNRDTTGVGVSILSYAGKLNFGLIVDSALIPNRDDVTTMAQKMVMEIDKVFHCVKDKYG